MIKDLTLSILGMALVGGLLSAAHAKPGEVQLRDSDCRRLVAHRAGEDTNYKPGFDVRGEAVAPADLNGAAAKVVPESFVIVLSLDLMERLDLVPGVEGLEADLPLGLVEIDGNVVTFNGQRLAPDAEEALAAFCHSALEEAARAR